MIKTTEGYVDELRAENERLRKAIEEALEVIEKSSGARLTPILDVRRILKEALNTVTVVGGFTIIADPDLPRDTVIVRGSRNQIVIKNLNPRGKIG
jgi:hypothetical protein